MRTKEKVLSIRNRRSFKKIYTSYLSLESIFTDKEAWGLFKISAFLETFGWTVLIIGIVCDVFSLPGDTFMLPIGGSIHGILYLFYVFIVFFGHRSMGWSIWRFLFAEAISVVPYGALLFELYVARERKKTSPYPKERSV